MKGTGISILVAVQIALIALKLLKLVKWSWFIILSPVLAFSGCLCLAVIVVVFIVGFGRRP